MRNFIIILALLLITLICTAQTLPDAPSRTFDKKFATLTGAAIGSAVLDAWSTGRNLDHGYIEQNMFLGQHPSKSSVWVLCMSESVGWSVAAYYVKRATRRSQSKLLRNAWVFFPTLTLSGHLHAGIHNIAIYDPVKYPLTK